MSPVIERVRLVVANTLQIAPESLHADVPIASLPNADSINVLNIILGLERELSIVIPDEATFNLRTVGELDRLVEELCDRRSST